MKALQECMETQELDIQLLDQMYSVNNKWIKLYSTFEMPDKYTTALFRNYIKRIEIKGFSEVEIILKEQYWKINPQKVER